jgi:hypothetical protein
MSPQPFVAATTSTPASSDSLLAGALAIAAGTYNAARGSAGQSWDREVDAAVVAARHRPHRYRRRALWLAALAVVLIIAVLPARAAAAVGEPCAGAGVPADRTSIQLFNFFGYVMGEQLNNSTQVQQVRTDEVPRRVSEMGYRNVEPVSFERRFSGGGL